MNLKQTDCLNKCLILSAMILLAGILASCDNTGIFEKNVAVENATWNRNDSIVIGFHIEDTIQPMNIIFNIRHTTDYNYSNLFMFVEAWYPDGYHTRDTLEFQLAQPDGRWLGKGFGKIREVNIPVKKGVRFPFKGDYRFVFEQAMRVDNLKGIKDIGLRIEKMQEK